METTVPKSTATELEKIDAAIKRNRSRVKRAMTAIDKLERKRKRLMTPAKPRTLADRPRAHTRVIGQDGYPIAEPVGVGLAVTVSEPAHHDAFVPKGDLAATADAGDIPEFLRRGVAAQAAADKVIADQIVAEQATTKTAKARGRIAKLKAKKAGDLKKMPLSGKAARALIDSGC
jgi:hypothetical protein